MGSQLSRIFLKISNALVSLTVILALCTAGLYSLYALWDNHRVYAAADAMREDLLRLKPSIDPEADNGASFEELRAINPDVCAWLTIDHTKIDFPVLQGETNFSYINTDVYGNFALAGSIFLDSRNDRQFHDPVSLIYGHHMSNSNMFGDLDKFKDKTFFDNNKTGMLILPHRAYQLEIYAYILAGASEDAISEPQAYQGDITPVLDYTQQHAAYFDAGTLAALRQANQAGDKTQVLALSTCSSEFTDARTIILAVMKPYSMNQEDR